MRSYLTVTEAAQLLGISARQVERRIQAGRLPALRVGRCWRVEASAILANAPEMELSPDVGLGELAALLAVPTSLLLSIPALPWRLDGRGFSCPSKAVRRWVADASVGDA